MCQGFLLLAGQIGMCRQDCVTFRKVDGGFLHFYGRFIFYYRASVESYGTSVATDLLENPIV